jgi:hypothetical protein
MLLPLLEEENFSFEYTLTKHYSFSPKDANDVKGLFDYVGKLINAEWSVGNFLSFMDDLNNNVLEIKTENTGVRADGKTDDLPMAMVFCLVQNFGLKGTLLNRVAVAFDGFLKKVRTEDCAQKLKKYLEKIKEKL